MDAGGLGLQLEAPLHSRGAVFHLKIGAKAKKSPACRLAATTPSGAQTISASSTIAHPSLHRGCDQSR
jgi:hypothetical protein